MKVIAIKHCSAGNESVGEMWKETAIFDFDAPIRKVLDWAKISTEHQSKVCLEITVGDES